MSTTNDTKVPYPHEDPLEQLRHAQESRRKSTSATKYAVTVVFLTLGTALLIALLGKIQGGSYCDGSTGIGPSQTQSLGYLCGRIHQILFFLIPGAISFCGSLGCIYMTYQHWKANTRQGWQSWFLSTWLLLLFSLTWITGTGTLAITGH